MGGWRRSRAGCVGCPVRAFAVPDSFAAWSLPVRKLTLAGALRPAATGRSPCGESVRRGGEAAGLSARGAVPNKVLAGVERAAGLG
jgi:hypothetical protein